MDSGQRCWSKIAKDPSWIHMRRFFTLVRFEITNFTANWISIVFLFIVESLKGGSVFGWTLESSFLVNVMTAVRAYRSKTNNSMAVCAEMFSIERQIESWTGKTTAASLLSSTKGSSSQTPLTRIHLLRCFGYFSNAAWEIERLR